jgi:hypothetical protein
MQAELQRVIAENKPTEVNPLVTNADMVQYIKDQSYFLSLETVELACEFGGKDILKPWKDGYRYVAQQRVSITPETKSEAIDMLCFCLNICLVAGITPDNVMQEYAEVWQKNMNRQHYGY